MGLWHVLLSSRRCATGKQKLETHQMIQNKHLFVAQTHSLSAIPLKFINGRIVVWRRIKLIYHEVETIAYLRKKGTAWEKTLRIHPYSPLTFQPYFVPTDLKGPAAFIHCINSPSPFHLTKSPLPTYLPAYLPTYLPTVFNRVPRLKCRVCPSVRLSVNTSTRPS